MPYIGNQIGVGNFVKLDSITTSATATYNLLNGGVAYSPQSPNHCIVSLNGVIQSPTTSFTISGSTIVFASALTATDVIDFILVLGDVLNIGTPSDATVGFAKVTSNLITGATAETSIDGADSVLIYDDSATALRKMTRTNFVAGVGATNTPAFLATRTSSQTISDSTTTKIEFSTEVFDTDSCYDNATNYRFTPNKAGKYLFFCKFMLANTAEPVQVLCTFQKNGSVTYEGFRQTANGSEVDVTCHQILEANGTTDYFEAFVFHQAGGNRNILGNSEQRTHFGGFFITT